VLTDTPSVQGVWTPCSICRNACLWRQNAREWVAGAGASARLSEKETRNGGLHVYLYAIKSTRIVVTTPGGGTTVPLGAGDNGCKSTSSYRAYPSVAILNTIIYPTLHGSQRDRLFYSVIDYQVSVACKGWCPEYSTAFICEVFEFSREEKRDSRGLELCTYLSYDRYIVKLLCIVSTLFTSQRQTSSIVAPLVRHSQRRCV
jgi:hypothetical protein